jgi:cellulose synthase/poly-beta-1,6-N-acetylglucosamine synthase-like glycosyltransferase
MVAVVSHGESASSPHRVGVEAVDLSRRGRQPTATPPTVSIVLPTLNERGYLRDCLDSLVAQDYEQVIEVLVVDGGSSDGTRALAEAVGARAEAVGPVVRVLDNPKVSAAAALNVGWRAAAGEIVVRADAHALYAPDYVRRCVAVLLETGADNVGGAMRAVGTTVFGRAVAAATSSPFGVGPGRFHYSRVREDVDTVYLGCYRRATLERLGGWDQDSLQWAAEDHELNFRLTRGGGRIVLDPAVRSWYFPRETWRGLARQYRNYGVGKVSTLAKHRALPTWRPLVPPAMVAGSVGAFVVGAALRRPVLGTAPVASYLIAVSAASASVAREPQVSFPHAALAMATCHWAYGIGFLEGLLRVLAGRGFDAKPRGGRR